MPPTGKKPFPPSKKIQDLDTEAKGRGRYEDGSLGPVRKSSFSIGKGVISDTRTVAEKLRDATIRAEGRTRIPKNKVPWRKVDG